MHRITNSPPTHQIFREFSGAENWPESALESPRSSTTQFPVAIVADELSPNKGRSTLALSRCTPEACEQAALHPDKLWITGKVRDVTGIHRTLAADQNQRLPILNVDLLTGVRVPRRVNQSSEEERWSKFLKAFTPSFSLSDAVASSPWNHRKQRNRLAHHFKLVVRVLRVHFRAGMACELLPQV